MTAVLQRVVRFAGLLNTGMVRVASVCLVLVMLALIANIVMRVAGSPLNGTFEVVAMLAAVVFGLSLGDAQNHGAHVSIDLLVRHWPRRIRIVVASVVTIVSIALFVQVITSLVVYGQVMRAQGSATESLGIPFWPAVYVVVVGFAGLVLALVADLARGALSWSTEDPELNVF
ncbi:hypothetical protein BHE97_03130 [Aeromicrobium sp. PE09-221]|uniref:TRAP transporter small permease subunit n=1 Tax=Aeromicrobium sp. PE09-221 TaxID=1898043 RepID=UPI000B3E5BB9|nr:TRAP transporter small permease [Aeromicrobium sp. PE09-221]OUZ12194.1 hypothetical protein BHE97_03130 [Aeromicrobium sp. PE09-221]